MILRLTYSGQQYDINTTLEVCDMSMVAGEAVAFAGWTECAVSVQPIGSGTYEVVSRFGVVTAELIGS